MPRKQCFWTRKLELELVEFVRKREFIWKPFGNTNHHIRQKYKAYAEFAAKLGRGFTARSVRDRWVNIRSTFNHNVRRVEKSKETATSPADVYVPCWPLWKPLHFLRDVSRKENGSLETYQHSLNYGESNEVAVKEEMQVEDLAVKEELQLEIEDPELLTLRQRGQRTDRPRKRMKVKKRNNNECQRVLDELIIAMKPLASSSEYEERSYWFFGKHVTERLNCMRNEDADSASCEILALINDWSTET